MSFGLKQPRPPADGVHEIVIFIYEMAEIKELTTKDLGELSGVADASIRNMYDGSGCPLEKAEKLLNALGYKLAVEKLEEEE